MIEFIHPWLFWLLPLPLFILYFTPHYKERKSSVKVPYFDRLVELTGEKPQEGAVILSRNRLQNILLYLTWICLVVAMAKPEMVGEPITQQKSARDLMISVDLSGSMAVEDFPTQKGKNIDRLSAVKIVISHFAKGRKHDRLGLILFGDAPYLQTPFTNDITAWLQLLNESEIGMAGQSTALGDSIGLAISVFENSKTENRVLIVLTDGNDTASKVPPIDAAKVAAGYNIKIYTIAIGDPTAVGEEKVDMQVLEEISRTTGGATFQALNSEELVQVYKEIDKLEPQKFDSLSFRPRTSAHHYPLALITVIYALIFTFLSLRHYYTHKGTR